MSIKQDTKSLDNLTPKEKAQDLFVYHFERFPSDYSDLYAKQEARFSANRVALEVIAALSLVWDKLDIPDVYEQLDYWQQVKKEIKAL